jgi:site-specific DNA recombinase
MTDTVALYARLSLARGEESVSIARQIEAGEQHAASRGWNVVSTFVDDGVSATHNKPEDRQGWRLLLDSPTHFDAVIVWKVDRLARRVLDFLHADEALQARGAGLVCVEDPIDMTTNSGRAFATLLAVFGEMEAAAISARVAAARTYLLKAGRVVGGTVPFGWQSIDNPDGPGMVLALDPEAAPIVRGWIESALGGASVYSIAKEGGRGYTTVQRILTHPLVAGMTPLNPGNKHHERGSEVLRDEQGLPVIDESVALLTVGERQRLLDLLSDPTSPQRRPRAARSTTSPLLAGLATCGECGTTMHRGTTTGRPSLTCPKCYQTVSLAQLHPHVLHRLTSERGTVERVTWISTSTGSDTTRLAEIENAIAHTTQAMAEDGADVPALVRQLDSQKQLRSDLRKAPAPRSWRGTGQSVVEALESASDDEERRIVLAEQVERIEIHRGRRGRYLDPSRVRITWKSTALVTPDGKRLVDREPKPGQIGVFGGLVIRTGSDRTYLPA